MAKTTCPAWLQNALLPPELHSKKISRGQLPDLFLDAGQSVRKLSHGSRSRGSGSFSYTLAGHAEAHVQGLPSTHECKKKPKLTSYRSDPLSLKTSAIFSDPRSTPCLLYLGTLDTP